MQNPVTLSANNDVSLVQNDVSITTRQLAEQLHTSKDVIIANAKKCLPNKKIEHGKATYWSKAEVTVILEFMKNHYSNNRSVELNSTVENTSTDLTPALRMIQAMEMFQKAANEELARLRAENVELGSFKFNTEKRLANGELVETPSENLRNHLWQNIQKVGSAINDYRGAWHKFWELVKRDTSIDVKTRAANREMKPLDYICNELDIDSFNRIYALSEKLKKECCGV